MTPNLTLEQIIEKALPSKNITCTLEKRLRINCQKELKEYIEDWHKRAMAEQSALNEKAKVY